MASTEQPTSILRPLVDDLHERRAKARLGGGEAKSQQQHGKGARTPRERRDLALTKRFPMVWLLDSAGARIQEAVGSLFAGSGHLFREEVVASGVIPQVAALMGPCAAGTAYIPGLADFVPMVSGRGSMALAGPHLVRAAIGENVTQEELGGSRVHCRVSGVGDLEVADDKECILRIKQYLSFMPQNCEEHPPRRST